MQASSIDLDLINVAAFFPSTLKMGHHHRKTPKSHTLPSSPTHSSSSSSSEFEFTVSVSPRKSSTTGTNLSPADDLFYKGQLLPLHLSPRISMVRTLLLSSSSSSSSATTTARHSSDSRSSFSTDGCGCDSSRPSSVTDDDLHLQTKLVLPSLSTSHVFSKKPNKYFSLSRFSYVFRKETKTSSTSTATTNSIGTGSSVRRMSMTAKEMIRKYLKKAKPLYEKLSHKTTPKKEKGVISGNLRYPIRRSCVSSCPSSMRSSPTHSGILCRKSVLRGSGGIYSSNSSSMEELQSAIQGAIAHCKTSMTQNN